MANSRDMFLLFLALFTGTLCVVSGWDVKAVASEAIIGQDATLKCDLTGIALDPSNNPDNLPSGFIEIESDGITYVSYNFFQGQLGTDLFSINNRYSYDVDTQTITVRSVECSDEKTFVCKLTVFDGATIVKSSQASFIVKVAPSVPDSMTSQPANLTGGIVEGSSVSATCNANTGRPNKGRIVWRIYRANVGVDVSDDNNGDGITIVRSQTSPLGGEPSCTERRISTIRIASLAASDQKLVFTCFVINDDFDSSVPATCESLQASLCQQSETVRIHYSVRDIKVLPSTNTDGIVEGRSVILTCEASGFPEPQYEWSKLEDNRTLGYSSELTLRNVGVDDSGNYSCLASNIVNGTTHNNYSVVSVHVVKVPPTTTPDPTKSTATEGPTGSPAKGSDSDDDNTVIIIIVVVIVVVAVVIAVIVGICIYRKTQSKKDPPRPIDIPFYNNKQTMGGPPDVLGDDKKKPIGSLNHAFDVKKEDGLMYADLTYDNRPRSRKPMAIGDTSSEYSDVQMPQV